MSIVTLHRTLALSVLGIALAAQAQTGTDRVEGLRDNTPRWHALAGARIVVAPGRVIERGTLVLKDGVVVAVGADVAVPAGARVWKLDGHIVYAGFIDLASSLGLPASLKPASVPRPMWGPGSELPPPETPPPAAPPPAARALAASNAFVRAEQDVAQQLQWKPADAVPWRELGFTAALVVPQAGVLRGQSALIALSGAADAKAAVIAPRVAQHLAFEFNRSAGDTRYPTSLMGAVALVRQTLLDARWYARAGTAQALATRANAERVEPNATLGALAPLIEGRQPLVGVAADEQDYLRVARLRDEFGLRALALGNGREYRRAAQLKALALPVVVPLAYPSPPEVADPDVALDIPLQDLQHWEQAPSNLALIERAGVSFAITPAGLKEPRKEFWPRLRQAVRRGLTPERALAALTTEPARLLGEAGRLLGTIEPGRIANVVVMRGDPFTDDEAEVELTFVDGRPHPTEAFGRFDPRGTWAVAGSGERLSITGTRAKPRIERDGASCDLAARGTEWVLRWSCGKGAAASLANSQVIVAGQREGRLVGTVQAGEGPLSAWAADRLAPPSAPPARESEPVPAAPAPGWPAGSFGIEPAPRPAAVLVKNATIWTQSAQSTSAAAANAAPGRLEGADLLVRAGRIAAVGRQLSAPPGAQVIDGTGKHVTPGLIDAHSHIAIAEGINEDSHSVTAEVRIVDALDATDVGIYRQLAGGVTSANLLHGSANTIGGQSQVIKLRWGSDAAGLVFEGAAPSIKFALGENVKGSNWGPGTRYPATRMGVEQVLRDAFAAAREYQRARREKPESHPTARRDLRLEALAEVLQGQRLVHVHSYRADEILMFARLARELGFTVAAFQHVLEGYKVADAIAAIGAGGSTFSDWWAYKMEVWDAIPANGAMMRAAGVVTTFNSDDEELGRRLNTEAAKAMKYGGVPEPEALAFVTRNAARQLRIEQRVGTLEPGKDADFVIWSGPPMSTYSRAEQTWIDGRRYFDLDTDRALRRSAEAERARLVALALQAKPAATPDGAATDAPADAAGPPRPPADRGRFEWRSAMDAARALRASYSEAAGWQECTEHGQ